MNKLLSAERPDPLISAKSSRKTADRTLIKSKKLGNL